MSFVMLPCAETTSLSFKYTNCLITKVIVTKLKQARIPNPFRGNGVPVALTGLGRSQSAGTFAYFSAFSKWSGESSSETLRNKSVMPNTGKKVSVHVPLHSKPLSDNDFGHYLAGLIDGDGHFSKAPQLVIVFNKLDASLPYFIKSRIGYGNIYKVKKKKQ